MVHRGLTRREVLTRAAAGSAAVGLAGGGVGMLDPMAARAAATRKAIPLPSPAQVRADFQRMVDFGPRLTGTAAHTMYVEWLAAEFERAGLELQPCDVYETSRWLADSFGLRVLDGPNAGEVTVASYFPRSQQTPPTGVTGPLVYGGAAPSLSLNGTGLAAFQAAVAAYPAQLESWAAALPGVLGDVRGSVMVVDLPFPPPLTIGELFGPEITYYNGQGETVADLATEDYKRLWTVPGLALPLSSFTAMGVAGVVFIVDASWEALQGQYAPFEWFNEDVPALYVDRDTGRSLRAATAGRPGARLTLTATRQTVPTPTVTAILPGVSDETIIFDTHTDGTGFVEENGGVALLQLARHFASLPASRRLKRTLVFAAWPGHFSNDLPQLNGWIKDHEDLVGKAAAALTVEHLGCSEWNDSVADGYAPTGRPEVLAVFTTQGLMSQLTQETVIAHDLPRTALLRPPVQVGVGGPFQAAGVPQIGAIAGPEYLLTISPGNDMDKLDDQLAARQIAWLADLTRRLDTASAAALRQRDPTLGKPSTTGNIVPSSSEPQPGQCAPITPGRAGTPGRDGAGRSADSLIRIGRLVIDLDGYQRTLHGVVLSLWTTHGTVERVEVSLVRGRTVVSDASFSRVGRHHRRILLRPRAGHRFTPGRHTLVIRVGGHVRARHVMHIP